MQTYIILSRFTSRTVTDPNELKSVAKVVSDKIRSECPGIHWKESYALMGRFDVVDIVETDDLKEVQKTAMIIRSYGNAATETMIATPWHDFLEML
ncbi:MAG: GYD domain-containing protein [Desulfurivibrionaceae bacterium]